MTDANRTPFSWNDITTKIVGGAVVALAVWVWQTNTRVSALEDYERFKAIMWDISTQDRARIQRLIREHNDHHPDEQLDDYLEWNKANWPRPE